MEEAGAQVAPPMLIHQALPSRYYEVPSMEKKRDLSYQTSSFLSLHQQHEQQFPDSLGNWNPSVWDWDSVRFIANPLGPESVQLGAASEHIRSDESALRKIPVDEVDVNLKLKLGGGFISTDEPVSRPNKRVRSRSPCNGNYSVCQVDNCGEDLSNAKDYHRRHKVCEVHSKATKTLVGKQMQRFCQQCSRFHPLSEFDEGKRSCRRRLAGHNRRRRKNPPDDVNSRLLLPKNLDNSSGENLNIINLLTALAHAQGNNKDKITNCKSIPDKDHLIQILSKINSLPSSSHIAAKLPISEAFSRNDINDSSLEHANRLKENASSTMDLLAVLSATSAASAPGALKILSQSNQSSDSEKTKHTSPEHTNDASLQRIPTLELGERSSGSCHSPIENSDFQVQDTRAGLPFQLFSSLPENNSPPKMASACKFHLHDSSNPTNHRSLSSSPTAQELFPMQASEKITKPVRMFRELNPYGESNRNHGSSTTSLDLFMGSHKIADTSSLETAPYQTGYASSSGSDHSPSSLSSDSQDRTGRILFKLFEKDPSHFPGSLRTQIYNWLSNSPSEMESYIRPGCIVLSLYLSMSPSTWGQLEQNLFQLVNSLVCDSDSDFWRNGRFLVHIGRKLVSHKDGKVHLCKSWRTWRAPELTLVSPLAVVGGQETSLLVRGRNLKNPGTKIHCTHRGGYASREASLLNFTYGGTKYDEINLECFKVLGAASGVLGRCFIEVENGFKGSYFPLIIANAAICRELRLLEPEICQETKACNVISEDQIQEAFHPASRKEALDFLNELGWLFQRRRTSQIVDGPAFSLIRFKFLLIFSVERDCCALVRTLLDLLVEDNFGRDSLSRGLTEALSEFQLLNRAVKRRCRDMVYLLTNYSVPSVSDISKKFIFPPNSVGPAGVTPLHLAACTSESEDVVDALTNDPLEIGLRCWNSLVDASGQSPHAHALMRGNHSYNKLVAKKLADKESAQVSVSITNDTEPSQLESDWDHKPMNQAKPSGLSCANCARIEGRYRYRRIHGSPGFIHRSYVLSMLAIASVCVCVCLFFRGSPNTGSATPFKWENLDYGTR